MISLLKFTLSQPALLSTLGLSLLVTFETQAWRKDRYEGSQEAYHNQQGPKDQDPMLLPPPAGPYLHRVSRLGLNACRGLVLAREPIVILVFHHLLLRGMRNPTSGGAD